MERVNAWTTYKKREEKKVMDLGKAYRAFLDRGKTERECVRETIRLAEKAGYVDLDKVETLQAGDRVYVNTMNKAIQLYIIGAEPLEKGFNIVGAHIDSPRMDLKQNPLYEDSDIAYLDTHYYGGIKKYQWVTLPLALHGVVAKKDGTVVDVVIGEDEDDPVVGISDLLIHLSATQHPARQEGQRGHRGRGSGRDRGRQAPEGRGKGAREGRHSGHFEGEVRHGGGGLPLRRDRGGPRGPKP